MLCDFQEKNTAKELKKLLTTIVSQTLPVPSRSTVPRSLLTQYEQRQGSGELGSHFHCPADRSETQLPPLEPLCDAR